MAVHVIKLPDVGEGVAEAEVVEWHVAPGDLVREDQIVAAVMTDKATVEIPSNAEGKVVWIAGKPGEKLAVGSDLIHIETDAATIIVAEEAFTSSEDAPAAAPISEPAPAKPQPETRTRRSEGKATPAQRPLAAPSVRGRARDAGVDLHFVHGSGPAGRITHDDLDAYLADGGKAPKPARQVDAVREIPVIGLRRKIAERMANAKRRIPHITIVEEIDVTALEELREKLNGERREGRPKLTLLPFVMAALVRAVRDRPAFNARYDDEAEVISEYGAVHIGIATQTKGGLMVPVVRHAEALTLWQAADELARLAEASRNGTATRDELSGSTITISSLGSLGALATTPIINHPEVAIIGVNRMEIRPAWNGSEFVPRKKMNLSSSFDHRVIDGWDAAVFVKRMKDLLETPALLFVEP